MKPPGLHKANSMVESSGRQLPGCFFFFFLLLEGWNEIAQNPQHPETLCSVEPWERFREANDDHKERKAQGWELIFTSSFAVADPHQHAQHTHSLYSPGAHQEPSKCRRGRGPRASWVGSPGGVDRAGRPAGIRPAVPRGPGPSCRHLCGKESFKGPALGPGLIYRALILPVQERGQVHQHGLTHSHQSLRKSLCLPAVTKPWPLYSYLFFFLSFSFPGCGHPQSSLHVRASPRKLIPLWWSS